MRIASWNCCQAFRDKWEYLDAFGPDLMVVPEAEEPARLPAALLERYPNHHSIGDVPFKGLLVMSTADCPFTILPDYDESLKLILPLEVGGSADLTLLAVWTQKNAKGNYTADLMDAIDAYEEHLEHAVIIGDFNSSVVLDQPRSARVTQA